jgi:hypothetical protein
MHQIEMTADDRIKCKIFNYICIRGVINCEYLLQYNGALTSFKLYHKIISKIYGKAME